MLRDSSPPVNVVYFALFFLAVWSMSLWHCFSWNAPLYFFAHATGQALLETGVLLLLSMLCRRWVLQLLAVASFALLLLHFTDFTLLRLMDDSVAYIFRYFFSAGPEHILVAFQALNFSGAMLLMLGVVLLGVPFAGLALYWLTGRLSKRLHARLIVWRFCLFLVAVGGSLSVLDVYGRPAMSGLAFQRLQKAMPLGVTLSKPESRKLTLGAPLARARDEQTVQAALAERPWIAERRPNIYLFVIETLRSDFITPDIAPHLAAFGQGAPAGFANATTTHVSWFAIFHATIPYHWTAMQSSWEKGSVPLQILKRCGYRLHVYSAADLALFHMDELLFGKGRALVDRVQEFGRDVTLAPWQRDAKCFEAARRDLRAPDGEQGNVLVFFLDSTHSEYSIPPDFERKFLPAPERIDYLTLTKDNIEPLKNRYRNAIAYVDGLFGEFISYLQHQGLYEEAVMAVTGDHGEEFFEEGALFHGTHLNRYQTSVPLFYKCPGMQLVSPSTSHVDLFPTLLHAITGESDFRGVFDGESAFTERRWPYRVSVMHAGAATPCEWMIERLGSETSERVRVRVRGNLYEATELELLEECGVWDAGCVVDAER